SIGVGTLDATGKATFATSSLSVGSHSITAVYGGDSNFKAAVSTAVVQVVNIAATTTAVTSSVNPSVTGQTVTFTATVSTTAPGAGVAGGTIQFKDGAGNLGGLITLDSAGKATFSV